MAGKNVLAKLAALILVTGAGAAGLYYYLQQLSPTPAPPTAMPAPAPPPQAAAPAPSEEAPQVIETPRARPQLPQLDESDGYVLNALTALVGNRSAMGIFQTDKIIHRIVATVDALPRDQVSVAVMPVAPASGMFSTVTRDGALYISPDNAARYNAYIRLADAVDPKPLVALYVRLYPLFQQAYTDLGYPDGYFNDRLLQAIDDLVAAPEPTGPVRLEQPHVQFVFADPELQRASIGQKIMIRLGSANEALIKAKLLAIRRELKLHMHAAPT
jgi:hypothetical protein